MHRILTVGCVVALIGSAMGAQGGGGRIPPQLLAQADNSFDSIASTSAFRASRSHPQKRRMLDMDPKRVSRMPTEQLVRACIRYPYLCDMLAWDSRHTAIQVMAEDFSPFRELLSREDCATEVFRAYKRIRYREENPHIDNGPADYIFASAFCESVLMLPAVVKRLGTTLASSIIRYGVEQYRAAEATDYRKAQLVRLMSVMLAHEQRLSQATPRVQPSRPDSSRVRQYGTNYSSTAVWAARQGSGELSRDTVVAKVERFLRERDSAPHAPHLK